MTMKEDHEPESRLSQEALFLHEARRLEYEHQEAELEQMYAEIYADPAYREEQLRLEALFAPALLDGLEGSK
jgi:hypothetical protein